ncbi:hypothetical protein [Streptomyces sp. NPDC059466]|uniref:hypothetical protein n=1 Tax=unclassified Streptomyces TaxID=2593676 RepID=UPI003696FAC8
MASGLDVGNCHSIGVTTAHTDRLTSAVTAMLATLGSLPPHADTDLDALSRANIAGSFDDLDLTELTGDTDASPPEHGVLGPRTLDDLLGNSPGAATDDNDR